MTGGMSCLPSRSTYFHGIGDLNCLERSDSYPNVKRAKFPTTRSLRLGPSPLDVTYTVRILIAAKMENHGSQGGSPHCWETGRSRGVDDLDRYCVQAYRGDRVSSSIFFIDPNPIFTGMVVHTSLVPRAIRRTF